MSWKKRAGEFVGIFIGVTLGAGLISMVMGGRRQPQPAQNQQNYQYQEQSRQGVFDQVASNVTSERRS